MRMFRTSLGFLLLTCATRIFCTDRNSFSLINNGYEDVWIAIHEDVPEDYTVITEIQNVFRDASAVMYSSTKNRAFFRNITIIVPHTWGSRPQYQPITVETFEAANIRVTQSQLAFPSPSTLQPGKCGQPGEYMDLPSVFFTDRSTATTNFGPSGKVIVHEWGHLRWGLFNEYPDETEPHFYFSWGAVEPIKCTGAISGSAVDKKLDSPCPYSGMSSIDKCRFKAVSEPRKSASMMYLHHLDQVVSFCESAFTDDPVVAHMMDSPSQQNKQCNHQSCWDVMSTHNDFKGVNNPPVQLSAADIEPHFRIVHKAQTTRCVLVLDYSLSMVHQVQRLKQAAGEYIIATVEDNSWLGIVSFCGTATTVAPMTQLSSMADRERLADLLPSAVCAGTSIAAGILQGISLLQAQGSTEGAMMLVMTDGHENVPPFLSSINNTLLQAGITMDTLAFSPAAQLNLGTLSLNTGGISFYASGASASVALHDSFAATVLLRGKGGVVALDTFNVAFNTPNAVYSSGFTIDDGIGFNTTCFFDYLNGPISVILTSPNGAVYDHTSAAYNHSTTRQSIRFSLPGIAEAGTWSFTIAHQGSQPGEVVVSVKSRVKPNTAAVTVEPFMELTEITYSTYTLMHVYAVVKSGGSPVLNAMVEAEMEDPSGKVVQFQLHDLGTGADTIKNDGIYSAYWLPDDMKKDGRYGLKVRVSSISSTVVNTRNIGSLAASTQFINSQNQTISGVQRVSSGGSLLVSNYSGSTTTSDILAPSQIRDLSLQSVSYHASTATLAWSAVGDDFDRGQATRYDMRWHWNISELYLNYAGCDVVPISWYSEGHPNVTKTSGSTEMITLKLPQKGPGVSFVFGLQAVDEVGNAGDVSNFVSVAVLEEPENVGLIVGLSVFGGCLLIISAAIIVVYLRNRSQQKPTSLLKT